MARCRLGYIRGFAVTLGHCQLPAPQTVLRCLQVWRCYYYAGFLPLRHMASNRSFEDFRLSSWKGSFYDDVYVTLNVVEGILSMFCR